jgi:hypothetical protein
LFYKHFTTEARCYLILDNLHPKPAKNLSIFLSGLILPSYPKQDSRG